MKYVVVIPDGASDYPLDELDGKTPLEVARTPNLDQLADQGTVGLARTIPEGMPPGSDVGNLSVFGYDPRRHYTGRGPIEAASMGIPLQSGKHGRRVPSGLQCGPHQHRGSTSADPVP